MTTGLVKTNGDPLREVTPEEWRRRCMALPEPLRYAVARVVWWDYFGERIAAERWPHLDHLIARTDVVSDNQLALGLSWVGYTPAKAASRAASPTYTQTGTGTPRPQDGADRTRQRPPKARRRPSEVSRRGKFLKHKVSKWGRK